MMQPLTDFTCERWNRRRAFKHLLVVVERRAVHRRFNGLNQPPDRYPRHPWTQPDQAPRSTPYADPIMRATAVISRA
jgi:hypothetical protein